MQTLTEQLVAALQAAKRELDADRDVGCLFCCEGTTEPHVSECPTPLIEAALDRAPAEAGALEQMRRARSK